QASPISTATARIDRRSPVERPVHRDSMIDSLLAASPPDRPRWRIPPHYGWPRRRISTRNLLPPIRRRREPVGCRGPLAVLPHQGIPSTRAAVPSADTRRTSGGRSKEQILMKVEQNWIGSWGWALLVLAVAAPAGGQGDQDDAIRAVRAV